MGRVTHAAIVANVDMGKQVTDLGPEDTTIAFLPSAHITQRIAVELFPMRMGIAVYFSEGLSRLPQELKSIRPTFFVAPPRVWERMYSSICTEIKKREPSPNGFSTEHSDWDPKPRGGVLKGAACLDGCRHC
jgi:long-chain acyl-CoA synthetase